MKLKYFNSNTERERMTVKKYEEGMGEMQVKGLNNVITFDE